MELEEGTPLWQLQKLPTEQGLQLLHKIIDGICGLTYPLYQDYHSVRDSAEGMRVLEDITTFFKAVVGKNLSDEEISHQSNQLNSSHQEAIMKCLKSRKDEIKKTLLAEIVDISSAQLQDFDWQIKVRIYLIMSIFFIWRRKWQPSLVFLLENPMNRGAWWATDPGVTKNQTEVFSGGEHFLFHFLNTLFFCNIIYLKWILVKGREFQKNIYFCFIN